MSPDPEIDTWNIHLNLIQLNFQLVCVCVCVEFA